MVTVTLAGRGVIDATGHHPFWDATTTLTRMRSIFAWATSW
jgi:hypothetical protein